MDKEFFQISTEENRFIRGLDCVIEPLCDFGNIDGCSGTADTVGEREHGDPLKCWHCHVHDAGHHFCLTFLDQSAGPFLMHWLVTRIAPSLMISRAAYVY